MGYVGNLQGFKAPRQALCRAGDLRHLGLYVGNLQHLDATMWALNCRAGANLRPLGLYVGNLQHFGGNNVRFLQGWCC